MGSKVINIKVNQPNYNVEPGIGPWKLFSHDIIKHMRESNVYVYQNVENFGMRIEATTSLSHHRVKHHISEECKIFSHQHLNY